MDLTFTHNMYINLELCPVQLFYGHITAVNAKVTETKLSYSKVEVMATKLYTVVIMLTLYNGNGYFTFNVDLFFNFLKHIKYNYKWELHTLLTHLGLPRFWWGPCCSCFNSIRCVFTL